MGDRDDLLRQLRRIARERSIALEVLTKQGKGSHVIVKLGTKSQVVPHKLKKGMRLAILKKLGVEQK